MDKSEQKIHKEALERLKNCIEDEETERNKMKDDLRFCTLDQWPVEVRQAREKDPNGARPCLTIDKINQYIGQVVNDMRQNRPGIKVRPVDDGGDVETAKVMQGLVRHIEDRSNAAVAYETAGESITRIGLGYFRVTTEYSSPDSFDQDIFIRPIFDTFSTYLGPHTLIDNSEYGFILEEVPLSVFERKYPGKKSKAADFDKLNDTPKWRSEDSITVCEYFYKEFKSAELLFLADGSTQTREEYTESKSTLDIVETRETQLESVKWCKLTGAEILEKRDWAGKYIPIVEVVGKESFVDGKMIRWGLVRPTKDNLRMYNYWASAATERMALAPKTPFVGAKGQFDGLEDPWKKANVENRAYLEYNPVDVNGNAIPPPQRVVPAPTEVAMVHMMQTIEHDVQASLGMFRAAVGEAQGQQSGRALLALERSSDTGTMHFPDNLARGIRFGGQIVVDLVPKIIDTRRALRILGEDGEPSQAMHDPDQQEPVRKVQTSDGKVRSIYNLGAGEYDTTVTVGASYNTKRMEAATLFTELSKGAADPASAATMRYLTVKNSDTSTSDNDLKALKALLPPPVLQAISSDEPISAQAQAQIAQLHQQMQQMQEQGQELQQENLKLKAGEASKMAAVQVDAAKEHDAHELAKKKQEEDHKLALAKAMDELALKEKVALKEIELDDLKAAAEHKRKVQELSDNKALEADRLEFDRQCRVVDDTAKREEKAQAEKEKAQVKKETEEPKLEKLLQEILKTLQNPPPRTVAIGGVQKDASGQITGASVSVKPRVLQ